MYIHTCVYVYIYIYIYMYTLHMFKHYIEHSERRLGGMLALLTNPRNAWVGLLV